MDDIITADQQLIFLLNTLSDDASQNQSMPTLLSLSFPEFVHAYCTVIIGMQALQMLPHNTDRSDLEDTTVKYTAEDRAKTRNRTLEMIRLLGCSSFSQQQKQKSVHIVNQPYNHINQRYIKRTVQACVGLELPKKKERVDDKNDSKNKGVACDSRRVLFHI
eukprot:14373399-Ditylum_brightwellii.AAC.1